MKKATRILSLVLALVLCVGVGVGATLAWLTAKTEVVTNTFYAEGLVKEFELKEHDVNLDEATGIYTQDKSKEVDGVKYKVTPANDLPKDPFIRINPNEQAYVFVEVNSTLPDTMKWAVDTDKWVKIENHNSAVTGEVWARKVLAEKDIEAIEYILKADEKGNTIHVTGDFNPESVTEATALTFKGYAVQYIGFESGAQAAWDGTYGKIA